MNINKTVNGNELTVALEGRLDTATAPQLEAELNQSIGVAVGISALPQQERI